VVDGWWLLVDGRWLFFLKTYSIAFSSVEIPSFLMVKK
jgi:hypothetical protein